MGRPCVGGGVAARGEVGEERALGVCVCGGCSFSALLPPDPGCSFLPPPSRFTPCSFENARGTPGGTSFCAGRSASPWKGGPKLSTVGGGGLGGLQMVGGGEPGLPWILGWV